jgi:hypothetical protein
MTTHDILDEASLFLYVASPDDIKAEQSRLEAWHHCRLMVYSVEHPTHSGARCTRVTWQQVD